MKESQCKQAAYFKKGGCTVVTDSLADLPAHVPVIPVSADNIEQIPHIINRIGYYLTLTGQNAAGNRMVPSSYKAYPPGQPQSNAVVNILYPRIALSAAYMGSEVQPCEKPR
ncbi:hypothetical protein BG257_20055 (plasmid) [Proteus mirabilis]|uniref:Uncharacterized protein n=3 Tax=Enterobacteriaceae TaxID=543 RepID=A0A3G4RK44_CITFR|nr:hypothetical protein KP64216b_00118 [Klebsiella pneumoniae]ATC76896.1 hypothetical protein BG257_20055 [Proteus mirabilis]ATD25966.1 hypothetical protein AN947_20100 [Vibrio cholerae]AUO37372.1 hypothetical protein YDC107_5255 [Escherichia coli]AYU66034.1 hypothetical protein [Citrobacter freundii]QYD12143.1 hypothetical protein [Serratia marcescens]UIX51295.1 hypothetical protein [Providencia rettgeri]BDD36311.1 hypothetical protein [uncultured bacterium]GAW47400.1 hypothetical protein 